MSQPTMAPHCPACGFQLRETDRFCPSCGQAIAIGPPPFQASPEFDRSTNLTQAVSERQPNWADRHRSLMVIGGIIIFFVVVGLLNRGKDGQSSRQSAQGPTATAVNAPVPTATFTTVQWEGNYPTFGDVRDLKVRPGDFYGKKLKLTGTIEFIRVADSNHIYKLGINQKRKFQTALILNVMNPAGDVTSVTIGYNGNSSGVYEGTNVVIYGTMIDTDDNAENVFGGNSESPLIDADNIRVIGKSTAA